MADAVATPSGGGEGAPAPGPTPDPPAPIPQEKPVEPAPDVTKQEAPEIKEPAAPEIKAPAAPEIPAPAALEIKAPAAPEIKAPAAPEIPAPAALEIKAPAAPEIKAPAAPEIPAPAALEIKAPAAPEIKAPAATEIKEPATPEIPAPAPTAPEVAPTVEQNGVSNQTDDWQKRESELLKKIEQLELVKNERTEDGLRLELKVREEEIDLLKARVTNLETELQAALSKPGGKNHEIIENIKQQHEELLNKARGMIFDKTKMVKNQELQIQALTTQVQSLKDINAITKDLLEIRNSEIKAMEERLQAMEARFKAEKERYTLVLQRATTTTSVNDDLRREYETQLGLFKELREKYEQRVQALVSENARLKDVITAKNNVAANTPNPGNPA